MAQARDGAGAAYRQSYRHLALRHGVHWATHERRLEHDVARDAALRRDLVRRKIDLPGQEEEVVVREPAVDARVHEVGHGESIGPFVAVEDVEGLRGIEDGVSVGGHGGGVGERLPVSAFFVRPDMLPQQGILGGVLIMPPMFERRQTLYNPVLGLGLVGS